MPIIAIDHTMNLDVNECKMSNGGCQHQCKNTNESYVCQCNVGFFLDSNGKRKDMRRYLILYLRNVNGYNELGVDHRSFSRTICFCSISSSLRKHR